MTDWGGKGPAGSWLVTGTTPGDTQYSGRLELEPSGNIYVAKWTSPEIGTQYGSGVVYNGAMLVSRGCCSSEDRRAAIVAYSLSALGHLQASWNAATIGGEIATGLGLGGRPQVLEGDKVITYWDNRGHAYPPMTLRIIPRGRAYHLRWQNPQSDELRFEGVGLRFDDGLTGAWSKADDHPQLDVLAFRPTSSDTAEAEWASLGFDTLGQETIRRTLRAGHCHAGL